MNGTNDTGTIVRYAALHAIGAAAYVLAIAYVITSIPHIAAPVPDFIGIATLLILLVISAAVMALLVFARPLMWYLDGEQAAAIRLVVATVVALLVIAVFFLFLIAIA